MSIFEFNKVTNVTTGEKIDFDNLTGDERVSILVDAILSEVGIGNTDDDECKQYLTPEVEDWTLFERHDYFLKALIKRMKQVQDNYINICGEGKVKEHRLKLRSEQFKY